MGLPDKWTKRFGISEAELAECKRKQGANATDSDLLFRYLTEEKISEAEYMTWASERYELPSVSAEFFSTPLDSVFWARIKSKYQWRASLFPLAQWDDVVVIACVEPPEKFDYKGQYRFVIAGAKAMQAHWDGLQPKQAPSKSDEKALPPPVQAAPEPQAPPEGSVFQKTPRDSDGSFLSMPDGLVGTLTSIKTNAIGGAEISTPIDSKPDGLTHAGGYGGERKESTKLAAMGSLELPDGIGTGVTQGLLDKLNFGSDLALDNQTSTEKIHEQLKGPAIERVVTPSASEISLPTITVQEAQTSASLPTAKLPEAQTGATLPTTKLPDPVPAKMAQATTSPSVQTVPSGTALTQASLITEKAPVKPPPIPTSLRADGKEAPAVMGPSHLPLGEGTSFGENPDFSAGKDPHVVNPKTDPGPLGHCENLDELAEHCLARTQQTFDGGGMILLFEGDGGLHPWKWTRHLASSLNKDLPVLNLGVRSVFRIVNRTFLPYHGYVKSSAENDRFFAAFHGGELPHHVTLVPVMMKKQILGMLMGVSRTDLSYKKTLPEFIALSTELAENIQRLRKAASAKKAAS